MQCCPLIRTIHHPDDEPEQARKFYTLVTALLTRLGWHRLERLLSAIPDSNDDFTIF